MREPNRLLKRQRRTIYIAGEVIDEFKVNCAKERFSMSEKLEQLISEYNQKIEGSFHGNKRNA